MKAQTRTTPKLIPVGTARRETRGLPIGSRNETLVPGVYD